MLISKRFVKSTGLKSGQPGFGKTKGNVQLAGVEPLIDLIVCVHAGILKLSSRMVVLTQRSEEKLPSERSSWFKYIRSFRTKVVYWCIGREVKPQRRVCHPFKTVTMTCLIHNVIGLVMWAHQKLFSQGVTVNWLSWFTWLTLLAQPLIWLYVAYLALLKKRIYICYWNDLIISIIHKLFIQDLK